MFYTLCASAGLRFGEALGIDIKNISPDCTTINICQKAWRGQIHNYLKSENGKREIDLHPTVAAMLKDFVGERNCGLLFSTRTGRQLSQQNILKRSLHPILSWESTCSPGRRSRSSRRCAMPPPLDCFRTVLLPAKPDNHLQQLFPLSLTTALRSKLTRIC